MVVHSNNKKRAKESLSEFTFISHSNMSIQCKNGLLFPDIMFDVSVRTGMMLAFKAMKAF